MLSVVGVGVRLRPLGAQPALQPAIPDVPSDQDGKSVASTPTVKEHRGGELISQLHDHQSDARRHVTTCRSTVAAACNDLHQHRSDVTPRRPKKELEVHPARTGLRHGRGDIVRS